MWRISRSELLSTFFPTWMWQGREWAKWRIPKYDPYYWLSAYSHPVLSSFYPPHVGASLVGARLDLDGAFTTLVINLLCHVLFCFIGWISLLQIWASPLIALFGAITLTFSAYNWKQQPCFQYTVAWFPWLLLGITKGSLWLSSISFGMILLAGYYPIGIQIFFISFLATLLWQTSSLLWIPLGLIIGSPQLVPFLKYLPKTIRTNKVSSIGKVPWWHPITLLFPKVCRTYINGVGYWEMAYYVGIVPLALISLSTSRVVLLAVVSYLLMIGVGSKWLPRIPARWCFSFQFALGWMAVSGLSHSHLSTGAIWCLLFIQAFDLWLNNSSLLVNEPYAELYNKPSWAFNTRLTRYLKEHLHEGNKVSGLPYPLFTGHINSIRTLGYCGGMQLKLMAKWRNDRNPDGAGSHDYFKDNIDDERVDRARLQFAYTNTKLDWLHTDVPHLWNNPRIS